MIRQRKKYSRPQRPFDKVRIEDENVLREKYGLKNKKEIWKADASIGRVRNLAKQLITGSDEEKQTFIEKLQSRGFKVEKIADVLSLDKEDWLKRRLQTVLLSKGLTTTPKQARQLIAHKHVSIGEQIVNIPSYMVTLEEEPSVKLNIVLRVAQKISKEGEIKKEIIEGESEQTDEEFAKKASENETEKDDDEVMDAKENQEEDTKEEATNKEPTTEKKSEEGVNKASEDTEDTKE